MIESSSDLQIYHYDESFVQITSDDQGIVRELSEFLTFDVPGAQFMPMYKHKVWDGKKRLLDYRNQTVYRGLVFYIIENFCKERNYTYSIDPELEKYLNPEVDIKNLIAKLGLNITPYDFQETAIETCIKDTRRTVVSPTSSGKSLIIYSLIRWYLYYLLTLPEFKATSNKILLVVPTIGLITQLHKEFKEYSNFDISKYVWDIHSGKTIPKDKRIVISTWQSIYKEQKDWFKQFGCIMIDEAHTVQAKSLTGILEKKCGHVPFRFGFTGTLQEAETHRLIIEGLIGPEYVTSQTHELRDRGITSDFKIKCLVLKYLKGTIQKKMDYPSEVDFLVHNQKRNRFIAKIASISTKNGSSNVLVLTDYHDQKPHIRLIKEELLKLGFEESKILIANGSTSAEERENIRILCEANSGYIILATYGVFSTGISIKNLQYLILATAGKSVIRILQSIGRIIRKDGKDNYVECIDISDDFQLSSRNYSLSHFMDRISLYMKSKFKYSVTTINNF